MRFFFLLLCMSTVLVTACTSQKSQSNRGPAGIYYVDPQYYSFQKEMLDALNFRAQVLKFIEAKKMHEKSDVSLTRAEGEWIREMGARYLQTRENILRMAIAEGEYFSGINEVRLAPYKGTEEKEESMASGDQFQSYKVLNVDPMDARGQKHIFRMHMALASSLILMDNYLTAIQPFNDNPGLRYILNYDNSQKKALQSIADSYSSSTRRRQIELAIKFVDEVMAWRRAQGFSTGPEESDLYTMAQSSVWYLTFKSGEAGTGFKDAVANLWDRLTLHGKRGLRVASYGLSMGFGNMVGLVESRKGYLNNMSEKEKAGLIAEMKPLDVLMEKTPFRLTDKMIPGHYGHVAIWLGTEDQLKDLKVWDQIPAKIQQRVHSGHYIVEALRPGVELNSLEHFLNIDDFLVVRDTRSSITDEYRRKAVMQAIAQIGKEYDFNFDVETHERIVCSEIAYVVFADIKWPLENTLNRYTISPDNVATMAVGQSRVFEPVIMYYDGKRVYKDLNYSLGLLLKANDQSYAEFRKFQNL